MSRFRKYADEHKSPLTGREAGAREAPSLAIRPDIAWQASQGQIIQKGSPSGIEAAIGPTEEGAAAPGFLDKYGWYIAAGAGALLLVGGIWYATSGPSRRRNPRRRRRRR